MSLNQQRKMNTLQSMTTEYTKVIHPVCQEGPFSSEPVGIRLPLSQTQTSRRFSWFSVEAKADLARPEVLQGCSLRNS